MLVGRVGIILLFSYNVIYLLILVIICKSYILQGARIITMNNLRAFSFYMPLNNESILQTFQGPLSPSQLSRFSRAAGDASAEFRMAACKQTWCISHTHAPPTRELLNGK